MFYGLWFILQRVEDTEAYFGQNIYEDYWMHTLHSDAGI